MDILNHNDIYDSDEDKDILDFINLLDGPRRPKMIRERPNNFHLWDEYDIDIMFCLRHNFIVGKVDVAPMLPGVEAGSPMYATDCPNLIR
ncbi:hypothetical protein RN001_006011 [Aquatica leii]|uniref:Uncharacterized protein n=1 Tax=Aquatica leii TaxID=1421715 RepID=A0AAN7SID0_9COLE|nr:hypothetical protein RN001_006011 [Aquatica leii]